MITKELKKAIYKDNNTVEHVNYAENCSCEEAVSTDNWLFHEELKGHPSPLGPGAAKCFSNIRSERHQTSSWIIHSTTSF